MLRVGGSEQHIRGRGRALSGTQKRGVNDLHVEAADGAMRVSKQSIDLQRQKFGKLGDLFCIVIFLLFTSLSLKYFPRSVIAGMLPQVDYKHYEV